MQIVIDIPEDMYKLISEDKYGVHQGRIYNMIRNGILLDKHDEEVIKETVESIWGKPPYTELLDMIRAEIEQNAYPIVYGVNSHEKGMTLYGIMQVIDKYKAESEDKE